MRINRHGWLPGPWDEEPDDLDWIDEETGFQCVIYRCRTGHLCGYVAVPKDHPWHGRDYNDSVPRPAGIESREIGGLLHSPVALVLAANDLAKESGTARIDSIIDCHGGVTWANRLEENGPWFFGFDCHHYMDYAPGSRHSDPASPYRDIDYVKAECRKLAKQLKAFGFAESLKGDDDA